MIGFHSNTVPVISKWEKEYDSRHGWVYVPK